MGRAALSQQYQLACRLLFTLLRIHYVKAEDSYMPNEEKKREKLKELLEDPQLAQNRDVTEIAVSILDNSFPIHPFNGENVVDVFRTICYECLFHESQAYF